ncbi:hypothetical protein FQZ97_865060 [compost metagenome]
MGGLLLLLSICISTTSSKSTVSITLTGPLILPNRVFGLKVSCTSNKLRLRYRSITLLRWFNIDVSMSMRLVPSQMDLPSRICAVCRLVPTSRAVFFNISLNDKSGV